MIETLVTIRRGRPEPVNAAEAEAWSELEEGATYTARFTQAKGKRSLSQSALYWKVCEMIADNTDLGLHKRAVSDFLLIESGRCTAAKFPDGTYRRFPDSIAFNNMAPVEFGRFLDGPGGAFDTAARVFGPVLAEYVRAELDRMINSEGADAPNKRVRASA